ncbi:hypothetical protein ACDQ55_16090 [Chitinophaga sp. 30R24]|uniref:hypothetical protein n=1 Tax=Chitinophaga sp. 30R24 TaxID=3248838 RepID=UPI003B8EB989
MKKVLAVFFVLMLFRLATMAQVNEISIKDLSVPTSPGLVLLDKAPASIEKPTSPKTFGISVLRLLQENEGAMEFTPYWFWNHPGLTFSDYIKNISPVLQTLNLSVAAAQRDTSTYLSVGFRTQVLRRYDAAQLAKIDQKVKEITAALSDDPDSLDLTKLEKLKGDLSAIRAAPLINIEVAGAIAGYSPDNKFSHLGNNRYGAWANFNYHPKDGSPFNALGVVRFTRAIAPAGKASGQDSSFIDYGVAAAYNNNKFDLQLEYVRRNDVLNHGTYNRLAFVGNYLFTDNLVIVASFGKDFAAENNIIALFGIKFGISNEKLKVIKEGM